VRQGQAMLQHQEKFMMDMLPGMYLADQSQIFPLHRLADLHKTDPWIDFDLSHSR
jgi:hypothetical protein